MSDVYAIYDPATDRVVGIYGTNRTMDDDRRRMLETVTEPGTHWHKESQVNRESWEDPARLEFVFLENFSERSDRDRLVKQWRTQRFHEARSIAKGLSGRGAPRTDADPGRSDHSACSFAERVEQWLALTESVFGGDKDARIEELPEAEREKITRLLKKNVGGEHAHEIATIFYNALCNYESYSYEPRAASPLIENEIPF